MAKQLADTPWTRVQVTDLNELALLVHRDISELRLALNQSAGVADHGALSGLADDDHPQYGALAQDEKVTGIWTFDNYVYLDDSANQIQVHSDGSGKLIIERNGTAGTCEIGNSGADLDTTVYGDLSVSKSLTVGDDITGTGGTTINGGTAASNGLALESTTNATKGGIFLASGTSAPIYTHGASSAYADMVLGSSLALKRTAISANTTLDITHCIVEVDCSGGNVTVTLPSASGKNGRVYVIRRIDNSGNTLTIAAASGSVNQLGAAAGSYTVAGRQQTKLYADGTSAWYEF